MASETTDRRKSLEERVTNGHYWTDTPAIHPDSTDRALFSRSPALEEVVAKGQYWEVNPGNYPNAPLWYLAWQRAEAAQRLLDQLQNSADSGTSIVRADLRPAIEYVDNVRRTALSQVSRFLPPRK